MKISRNAPCFCGSGKKYKNCCLKKARVESKDDFDLIETMDYTQEDTENMGFKVLEGLSRLMIELRDRKLKKKDHIKKYKAMRKLHGEICDKMYDFILKEQYVPHFNDVNIYKEIVKSVLGTDEVFDIDTTLGFQCLLNHLVYKNHPCMQSLSEVFLEKKKFRKTEKIDFLNSMLNSKAGLFEVIKTDEDEGYVYLKDVLSNKEFCIIDIAFSGDNKSKNIYIYTRIIVYNNIAMSSGLNLVFNKEDRKIKQWIEKNKENYNEDFELKRFLELYLLNIDSDNKMSTLTNLL